MNAPPDPVRTALQDAEELPAATIAFEAAPVFPRCRGRRALPVGPDLCRCDFDAADAALAQQLENVRRIVRCPRDVREGEPQHVARSRATYLPIMSSTVSAPIM